MKRPYVLAHEVCIGDQLLNADGVVGIVLDIVWIASDPNHVGLRIAHGDGLTSAVFPTHAVLVPAS